MAILCQQYVCTGSPLGKIFARDNIAYVLRMERDFHSTYDSARQEETV
jgi:hypothetical protein